MCKRERDMTSYEISFDFILFYFIINYLIMPLNVMKFYFNDTKIKTREL